MNRRLTEEIEETVWNDMDASKEWKKSMVQENITMEPQKEKEKNHRELVETNKKGCRKKSGKRME